MDEVRSSKLGVRLSAADRIGAAVVPDSEGRRLLINLGVVAAVLVTAVGLTFYIWHDVGTAGMTDRPPAASAQVEEIERLLGELSFTPGLVDGVMDPETAEAIRAFEQAAGLPEDGLPTPSLLEELKAVAGHTD